MATEDSPPDRLRERLRTAAPLIVPGVTDGITAALAAAAGFTTVYVSGAGTAATRGFPDMSVLSLPELVDAVRVVSPHADPVVDLDTGFGGAAAIRRAMRDMAAAGAAAIHIEDQPFPRRCGYLTAEPCVPVADMLRRMDAVRVSGTNLVVVARTDALLVSGLDEAMARVAAYADAGAELVFVNGLRTLDELRAVRAAVDAPLLYNVSGSDRSPWLTRAEAAEIGVAMVIHPIQAARAAANAVRRYLAGLAADVAPAAADLLSFADYMMLAGWDDAAAFEQGLPERRDDVPSPGVGIGDAGR